MATGGEAWGGHGEAATTHSLPAAPNVAGSLAELVQYSTCQYRLVGVLKIVIACAWVKKHAKNGEKTAKKGTISKT